MNGLHCIEAGDVMRADGSYKLISRANQGSRMSLLSGRTGSERMASQNASMNEVAVDRNSELW